MTGPSINLSILYNTLILGMLYNFSTLISKYGMVPNGNRVYYTRRSQPPMFPSMVDAYYKVYYSFQIWSTYVITRYPIYNRVHFRAQKISNSLSSWLIQWMLSLCFGLKIGQQLCQWRTRNSWWPTILPMFHFPDPVKLFITQSLHSNRYFSKKWLIWLSMI